MGNSSGCDPQMAVRARTHRPAVPDEDGNYPPMAAQFKQLVQNGIPMDPDIEAAIWRLLVGESS